MPTTFDIVGLASELADAYAQRRALEGPPSARFAGFDLPMAFAVERELAARRVASGARIVGRKIGYANKAMWRALKLDTLVWAHMYDDTVRFATGNAATLSRAAMYAPKIEPEIVFKLGSSIPDGATDPATILRHAEWFALGFEIIDCVYPDWKFQPADFVASYGFHAALVVGDPQPLAGADLSVVATQLAQFTVRLERDGELVAEGAGRNVLRNPASALGELASAIARQAGATPLVAGDLVSSGTLTESQFIAAGQTWTAVVSGLDVPSLVARVA